VAADVDVGVADMEAAMAARAMAEVVADMVASRADMAVAVTDNSKVDMEAMVSSSRAAMVDTDRTREDTDSRVDMEVEDTAAVAREATEDTRSTYTPLPEILYSYRENPYLYLIQQTLYLQMG